MAVSSFNIQPANKNAFFHNSREAIVTYTIDDSSGNEINRRAKEAIAYYTKLLEESTKNYVSRTKQKIQTKEEKFLWEAVVNLNENNTLEDVKKLVKKLEEEFELQSVQIAVHRDEGFIDVQGYLGHYSFKKLINV